MSFDNDDQLRSFHSSCRKAGAVAHDRAAAVSTPRRLAPARSYGYNARGFSLVEIMVVVVIIGLLAGMVTVGFAKYLDAAKKNVAKSDITTIAKEVKGFYLINNRYPTNDEGIEVLKLDSSGLDPWGNPYEYNSPAGNGEPFEVFTLGEDGQEGGDGNNADIYSWQINDAQATEQ